MPLSTAVPRRRGIFAGAGIAVAALALAACSSGTTDASGSGENSAEMGTRDHQDITTLLAPRRLCARRGRP